MMEKQARICYDEEKRAGRKKNMLKLAVFDLDGTLASLGQPMEQAAVEKLRLLEDRGVRIAVCSGKHTYYLCGFMRQVGLKAPVLVGENGAVIQFGVELPPREYRVLPYSREARESLHLLREELNRVLPNLWYQPNQVGLTPFPQNREEFEMIEACVTRLGDRLRDVDIYRHCDSFDVMPRGTSKATGLAYLARRLGVGPGETAAVGDGVNDYPMFAWAGLALGIRVAESCRVDRNFDAVTQALDHLLGICQGDAC